LLLAAAMSLVLVAFLVPLALLLREVAADRAVTAATARAQSLTSVVTTEGRQALQPAVDQLNTTGDYPVTVYLPNGTVVGDPVPSTPGVRLAALRGSITVTQPGQREILIAVQGLPGGTAVVRTVVDDAELTHGLVSAWLVLVLLGLVLLVLGVVLADRLARSIVRPIGDLATVSHRLASGDLAARTRPDGPGEVRAVASALNHLATRIGDLVVQEREAVADISHRLRTPLTAFRLEAEALRDPEDAARIGRHAENLERAVTALIEAARSRDSGPGVCDAVRVIAERTEFWSPLAQDEHRTMAVESVPGPLPIAVGAEEFAACVDALIGNVFAYTPEGTWFAVRLTRHSRGGTRLVVEDGGPGFGGGAAPTRGSSGGGSTGLGLDIAARTAQASGGSLTLGTGAGAKVVLELGPPGMS
jgi:signal transduction histidine kinase